MHLKATQGKEVVVKIANRIGVLANLAQYLADRGINLLAVNAQVTGNEATIRLVTDDNLRADDILREHGYNPHEEDVVLLSIPHKAGMLHRVSEILAEAMIDIREIYASAWEMEGNCMLVLHTNNDAQALVRFNEMRIGV
ncbi:ACT domain-containing protein [Coraliomargarita parva]|uniref:ACT domain-containing protein n=1 Tax=Coraliomargarita parva TaxID=3014050 RepID=UPI0022B41AB2|nr:ACT domain-containing protein [Coraliomargarita parva]